ncbi:mandelate racemase/muconate lactonizing enzyme family protein [Halorientalis pallida]|uniref:Mandelate racemase/muconate lactonizing enzyme family protein n=1 Tax=Halorientalis pallida TaxID=2479928 RepID=A0A498L290_9EURY|nr:mandelate racemase/muconate lactonizing enzyme family protein [Halorientalis pallida]RXK50256.1 mandelate racemase/muconate lactonizing enzyme family protein [Halorientalis pallida]
MQITGVDQYHLEHQAAGSFEPTWIPGYPQGTHEVELFEIETDTGLTGYGAMPSFAGGMDFSEPLSYFLLGEDPHDVEGILRKLDSINLVGPRPWGVEIAMWDLIGKDAGKPIYELLGGTASEIPVYASTGEVVPAAERIDYVEDVIADGVGAVKLRVTEPDHIEIVRKVRDAYPELPLMVDANKGWAVRVMADERQWSFREALAFARGLEEVGNVRWLEEPLPRHDYEGYARLREAVDVPIAGGEFNDGIHHFREFVRQGSLDILQPDAALATGIKRADEVAAMARQHGLEYVPHTWTNGIGFVANLHVMVANDSPWCEFPMEPPWTPDVRDFLLEATVDHEDGVVTPPEGPGLGVEVDESLLS